MKTINSFRTIVSNREYSQWPSWLMVYEWEDIFSKVLSAEIGNFRMISEGPQCNCNEFFICFLLLARDLENLPKNPQIVPVVMDVWKQDIELFIQQTEKYKLTFVTSLEALNILRDRGCNNVAYLPYSFPDHYELDSFPHKDIDIIQFGRTNPILDSYMVQLLKCCPELNYVTTVHHQGQIFFHSSLYGIVGPSDTRKKFMNVLARSTISLVSTAGMDGSRDTGGFNTVSPRFYESAACFCHIIGRFPHNEEFDVLGFDKIASRVGSYQQFEALVMDCLGKPFDNIEEYRQILKNHTTSNRASLARNVLLGLCGVQKNLSTNETTMNPEFIKKQLINNSDQQSFQEDLKGRMSAAVNPVYKAIHTNPFELSSLSDFLLMIAAQTYPEAPSIVHSQITRQAIDRLGELFPFKPGSRVLDVGCGQGPALPLFLEMGLLPVGITINEEDLAVCCRDGFTVVNMDQSFLDFSEKSFSLVWARHVVEHSIFPLFTLTGFSRVLKDDGVLYLEVPAPDTACHHERNPNHYSMLPKSSWISLLQRAGFNLIEEADYQFCVPAGDDIYWGFYCRKLSKGQAVYGTLS